MDMIEKTDEESEVRQDEVVAGLEGRESLRDILLAIMTKLIELEINVEQLVRMSQIYRTNGMAGLTNPYVTWGSGTSWGGQTWTGTSRTAS